MAAAKVESDNLRELMALLGGISEDDCNLLMEEYNTTDPLEVTDAVFESMASSNFDTVSDLVWHIRQNPCYGVKRSHSLRERNVNDAWCLARSKSSNTINKHASSLPTTPQQRPSSAAGQIPIQAAMPFSGTKNPVSIVRAPKNFDCDTLRLYLSKYLQDNDMRNIIYDVYENRNPKQMILLRGASGSGKSTLALVLWSISEKGEICSADHYFINRHGQYNFKREQLGEAHASCRTKCQNAMQRAESPVIIDNTNTRVDEMFPYVQLAVEHNYDIQIVEPKTEWKKKANMLAQKTVHGVPKRTIQDQLDRFETTTVKSMVDRVLKQQRSRVSTYKPARSLEWGTVASVEGIGEWDGTSLTTASSPVFTTTTSKPMATNNFQPTMTPAIKPNMSSQRSPQSIFGFPAPRTNPQPPVVAQTTLNPLVSKPTPYFPVGFQSSKPAVPNLPQSSWTEMLTTVPTSPRMISDWVPDIKVGNGNGNGKSQRGKKSGKQKTNANTSTTGPTPSYVMPTDFIDPAHIAFEKLCKLFSNAPRDEVERIFNLYEGDVESCASALMDEGFEFSELGDSEEKGQSVPSSTGSPPPLSPSECADENPANAWEEPLINKLNMTDNFSNADIEVYENKEYHISYQGNFEDPTTSTSSGSGGDVATIDEEADYVDMVLPTTFAKVLLTAFGHPDDESRVLSKDELLIKVSPDIAFELYKSLYLNMHKAETEGATRAGSEETTRSNTPSSPTDDDEFNEIAISISQMELETSSGNPKLSSIIDIESKISLQTHESFKKYTAPNRTMAQNLNFCRLKQCYPHIDVAVIDEIYCQYQLDMDKTVGFLNEMYCQSLNPYEQPSTSYGVISDENEWHLKYNPRDVKLYSIEELKSITKTYEEMEHEWMSEMNKIKEYHQKCKSLSNSQVKAFYISEAKKLSDSMKHRSEEMQYYKAITQNAKHKNDQILDLHGLKVNGAMRVLKEFLQFKEDEFLSCGVPKMILLIITGQGKHSKNGCPVLQPAVKNFLAQKSYKYHSSKPGTYTVVLTRGSVARKR